MREDLAAAMHPVFVVGILIIALAFVATPFNRGAATLD